MERPALRLGGVPLLPRDLAWPQCHRHGRPLLFRAQLPIATTTIAAASDPRMLAVFECHADHSCREGEVLVVRDALAPRESPGPTGWDLRLLDLGRSPLTVLCALSAVTPAPVNHLPLPTRIPTRCAEATAHDTALMLRDLGAEVYAVPASEARLATCHGARLVAFEDDLDDPMPIATDEGLRAVVVGLRRREPILRCDGCDRDTRVVARLLPFRDSPTDRLLGLTAVRMCLRCDRGWLRRFG